MYNNTSYHLQRVGQYNVVSVTLEALFIYIIPNNKDPRVDPLGTPDESSTEEDT